MEFLIILPSDAANLKITWVKKTCHDAAQCLLPNVMGPPDIMVITSGYKVITKWTLHLYHSLPSNIHLHLDMDFVHFVIKWLTHQERQSSLSESSYVNLRTNSSSKLALGNQYLLPMHASLWKCCQHICKYLVKSWTAPSIRRNVWSNGAINEDSCK